MHLQVCVDLLCYELGLWEAILLSSSSFCVVVPVFSLSPWTPPYWVLGIHFYLTLSHITIFQNVGFQSQKAIFMLFTTPSYLQVFYLILSSAFEEFRVPIDGNTL